MLNLTANIRDIKVGDLPELVVALVPNILGNDGVGIRGLVDILLNVFQEGSTIFPARIGKHHLFLDLAGDMIPLGCRVPVIGCQGRPIELFLNHLDNTNPDGDRASDNGGCHGLNLGTRKSKVDDTH